MRNMLRGNYRNKGWQPLQLTVLASSLSLMMSFAGAQELPDAGTLLNTVKPPAPKIKPAPEIGVPPAPKPALKPAPDLTVKVSSFKITGNTVYSEKSLLALIANQVGKEFDFDGLSQIADKIAVYYRSNGYFLAQAYLPEQKIVGGVIEITVLEGRVGEVKLNMSKDARLRESKARAILEAIQPGTLVNEEGLERGLLLLNDTPGAVVKSTLQPGAKVGTVDTVVDFGDDGKRVSGSVAVDNWGSRFTGEARLGATLNVNNPSGYGDLFSIYALNSSSGEQPSTRLSYVVPISSSGTKLGVSFSALRYKIGGDFTSLDTKGWATDVSGYVLHPFVRTRNLNMFGMLGADKKRLLDIISTSRTERSITIYRAGISGDSRDDVLGGGLNTFSLALTGGKAADKSNATSNIFRKTNYDFQRAQLIRGNVSLLLAVSGQAVSEDLKLSTEKFTLGGPNSIRAYPVGEASGDDGIMSNVELRWSIPQTDFTLGGFVDSGAVRINHTDPHARNLSGYGVGFNWGKRGYQLRTSVAWHGKSSHQASVTDSSADRNPRLWMQFSKSF